MVELIVTSPDGTVERHPLGEQATIGRHPDCEVAVTDPMASRRHCRIMQIAGGQYAVVDNGSANGTLLNGAPLQSQMPLRHGDELTIGSTRLTLHAEGLGVPAPLPSPQAKAASGDMSLSIVRLQGDAVEADVAFDYATSAEARPIEEAEASADVQGLKLVTQRLRLPAQHPCGSRGRRAPDGPTRS